MLLVEHKSRGKDLGKAESQAFRYIQDLVREGRQDEVPRYVIVSDFARIALHDLGAGRPARLPLFAGRRVETIEFPLADLHRHIHDFAFIPGYQQHRFEDQDPINLRAVAIMDDLHDALEAGGYRGHELERFLVRVLFCLFAQDTGIFEREAFRLYIEDRTEAGRLRPWAFTSRVCSTCSTRRRRSGRRTSTRRWRLSPMSTASFSPSSLVSPTSTATCAIACWPARGSTGRRFRPPFSARFSRRHGAARAPADRRPLHQRARHPQGRAVAVPRRLAGGVRAHQGQQEPIEAVSTRSLPACVSSTRPAAAAISSSSPTANLRLLEIEVLKVLCTARQQQLDIQTLSLVDVDAFYGIEISEWPARIAEVAMWLMDHQMNIRLSESLRPILRPAAAEEIADHRLRQRLAAGLEGNPSARAVQLTCWAIRRSWESSSWTAEQSEDMELVCGHIKGHGCSTMLPPGM